MTDSEEYAYENGRRNALIRQLRNIVGELGPDDPTATAEKWRIERAETVSFLRRLCEEYGDNDWPDKLHLVDVLEKHLERYLSAE